MDALKKAEQDKKKAAENQQTNLAAGGVAGGGARDEPDLEFARAGAEPPGDTSQGGGYRQARRPI